MNKLITIGGINNTISYLNISREEAVMRYSKDERISYKEPDEIFEFEFEDSFRFNDTN